MKTGRRYVQAVRKGSGAGILTMGLALAVMAAAAAAADPAPPRSGDGKGAPGAQAGRLTTLWFVEREPGVEPYRSRMLLSADFLRMDDGRDEDDFVLFDRHSRTIYSVTHGDRTILRIEAMPVTIKPPYALELGLRREPQADAPRMAGKVPEHLQFTVNGKTCFDVIAVEGLLPDVTAAMREFHLSLAGEQAANLPKTPLEMQTPCMLANVVFHPARHLEYGFPVREWDYRGYSRELVDFRQQEGGSSALFRVPEGYATYSMFEQTRRASPGLTPGEAR